MACRWLFLDCRPAMQELDLSYNQITGNISNLLYLAVAKRLTLSYNAITGTLPPMSSFAPGYVSPAPLTQCMESCGPC